jgi:hypothetical protein
MIAVLLGLAFLGFAVFAALPSGLHWGPYMIDFLKGASPVLAAFVGVMTVCIGIADIKDKADAKKEEADSKRH